MQGEEREVKELRRGEGGGGGKGTVWVEAIKPSLLVSWQSGSLVEICSYLFKNLLTILSFISCNPTNIDRRWRTQPLVLHAHTCPFGLHLPLSKYFTHMNTHK